MTNSIIEISKKKTKAGRTPIKVVLHKLHKSDTEYNLNGLTWIKEYCENNIDSVNGMQLVTQFLDDKHEIPFGDHGNMQIEENKVVFKDSLVVGTFTKGYIAENLEVNGEIIDAVVGEGYIYHQRFPKLVDYLQEQKDNGVPVDGSVEICAAESKGNTKIIYDGGWKEKGRIPKEFDYSGHALVIGTTPADNSSLMIELNAHKIKDALNKEGGQNMNEVEKLNATIAELNAQIGELNANIANLTADITAKDEKITEVNGLLVEANKTLEETKTKCTELETECNTYRAKEEQAVAEQKKVEVNSYFENEIPKNNFDEVEVNALKEFVEKVDLEGLKNAEKELVFKKFKEGKLNIETNAQRTNDNLFFPTKEEKLSDIEAGKALFN